MDGGQDGHAVTTPSIRLRQAAPKAFIVAHREDTTELESTLQSQGFAVQVVKGPYTPEQLEYSALVRCLINHANVWKIVATENQDCLVVEADFVPVKDFGSLRSPLPHRPDDPGVGLGWLYSAGSTLYGIDEEGYPFGHGNTTVAYQLTPAAAKALLDFFEREMAVEDPGTYRPWETYLGVYMRRERGFRNYIPVYQYGEHGGVPNTEHASVHKRGWHQADLLMGPLEFQPQYARNAPLHYRFIRLRGYVRAWVRLLRLRFYDHRYVDPGMDRMKMARLAIARMFHLA
jgi:hypothetical protein